MSLDLQARLFEERTAADISAQKLNSDQHARWESCRSSHRFMAFHGKQLVAYRLLFLRPEITDIFTCRGLDVALATGLSSLWESQNTGKQFWVSHTPKEVAPGCFLWMLKYSSLEFVDYQGGKSLMFSLAYRINKNPKEKVDGTHYLLEKSVFDNTHFEG
jgi:hypothetical protein